MAEANSPRLFRSISRSSDGRGNTFLDAVAEDGTAWSRRIAPPEEYDWEPIQPLPAQEITNG